MLMMAINLVVVLVGHYEILHLPSQNGTNEKFWLEI